MFLGVVALAATVFASRPTARAAGPIADVVAATPLAAQDPSVLRSRVVAIDFSTLPDTARRRPLARERAFPLDLFPDVSVLATFDHFDPNASGVTWVGHVDGIPMSTVTLVYGGGLLTGSVVLGTAHYQIRPFADPAASRSAGAALHVVSQVDQNALPREAPPIEVELSAAERAAADARPLVDAGDIVELMVVYTPTAMAHAGGAAAIANLINLGVSESNTSFATSGINHRLRLVHTELVNYTETSAFGQSLNDVRVGNGAFSGVAALREAHRADLVMLLIHPQSPDACGVAYLMTSLTTGFAPFGFSVVDTQCVSPTFAFAHEIGHNSGARHDWYVDSGVTPFSYAHGYANPALGQRWRTIMAYNDLCSDQGFNCTRLLSWANPDNRLNPFCSGRGFTCAPQFWYFPGTPMGVAGGTRSNCRFNNVESVECDADDRRALNNTALTVANFRQR